MFFLIFLFPIIAFGQREIEPDAQYCRAEYFKIMSCVRDKTLFEKMYNEFLIPEDRPLLEELEHVLNCRRQFGDLNCISTHIFIGFIEHTVKSVQLFLDFLEPCLKRATLSVLELSELCGPPARLRHCQDYESEQLQCIYEELKKVPACENLEFKPLSDYVKERKTSCYISIDLHEILKTIGIEDDVPEIRGSS